MVACAPPVSTYMEYLFPSLLPACVSLKLKHVSRRQHVVVSCFFSPHLRACLLILDRRAGEREGEKHGLVASRRPHNLGPNPQLSASPDGNRTHDLRFTGRRSNQPGLGGVFCLFVLFFKSIQPLCLLIEEFNPFTFKVTVDR